VLLARASRRCTPPARSRQLCLRSRGGHARHPGSGGHADDRVHPDDPGQRGLSKAYYLEQNAYVEWPATAACTTSRFPGQHETGLALPWGGTSHPVWFKRDPRVANVKVLGGVFNRR